MKNRILAGIRPTGKLHWGNYFGALANWVALQEKGECFFFIADWHSLTTEYADAGRIREWTREVLKDVLAAGVDPEKATLFVQSDVKEHAELSLILSMMAPLGWLERVPTYKEQQQELKGKDLHTHGFLGYPVLQSADILLYQADQVPVGEDQVPHLEFTRELLRRVHHLTGQKIFTEPQPLLTKAPRVPGLDGRKMSKSYDNAIWLDDVPVAIEKKGMQTLTDPARKRREDKGNPDNCRVYDYHKLVSDAATLRWSDQGCRSAEIGCVDCKKKLIANAIDFFAPFREKKEYWNKHEKKLDDILKAGAVKARKVAAETMGKVYAALGMKES